MHFHKPDSISIDCSGGSSTTGTLVRERGLLDAQLVCSIDLSQQNADILLGEEITISAQSNTLHSSFWQEDWTVASSEGWSTPISVRIQWSNLQNNLGNEIQLEGEMDSFSLDMFIEGNLTRE